MTNKLDWRLPEGVAPLLPPEALRLDSLRGQWLDAFRLSGYQLVQTPFIDFGASLLAGAGSDLIDQSFKLTDPVGGEQLAIRADITPQIARIDAHSLPTDRVARYCYAGTVLRTHPMELAGSRCPLQSGVELYGHAGLEADLEVMALMLDALAGLQRPLVLDLNHIGVFRQLVASAALNEAQQQQYFDLLQRKARSELESWLSTQVSPAWQTPLRAMLDLYGDAASVLDQAWAALACEPLIAPILSQLQQVLDWLSRHYPQVGLYLDLAEIRGYDYHTGLLFAVYSQGLGRALAQGGRYDEVGKKFGRSRPATGFSADLRLIAELLPLPDPEMGGILAPVFEDAGLQREIQALRQQGLVVFQQLGPIEDYRDRCDRKLVAVAGHWQLQPI